MSNQLGKFSLTAGQTTRIEVGGTGLSGFMIGNESGLTCKVQLVGASSNRTLYPGTVDFFTVPTSSSWNGVINITPSADLNNIASWPGSYVYVDSYGSNEKPTGQYPFTLNRAGNIGNTVNTSMGGSNNLQNDGNVGSTQFLEVTETGSPSSNYSFLASGDLYIGQYVTSVFKKLWEIVTGTTPVMYFLNRFFSFSGSDVQIADNAGNLAHVIGIDGSGDTYLQFHSTGKTLIMYDHNGSAMYKFDEAGNITCYKDSMTLLDHTGATILKFGDGQLGYLTIGDLIDARFTDLFIKSPAGGNIFFQTPNGTSVAEIETDATFNLTGKIQQVNGDTSGSMVIYEGIVGPYRIWFLFQNNYRQAGAGQTITLGHPFTNGGQVWSSGIGGINFKQNGVAQNISVQTSLSSTGGTETNVTQLQGSANGRVPTNYNQISSNGGYAVAHVGFAWGIGL